MDVVFKFFLESNKITRKTEEKTYMSLWYQEPLARMIYYYLLVKIRNWQVTDYWL